MAAPKQYRTMAEFEREELRPNFKAGFSIDDLMQETTFGESELLFDDSVDEFDPDSR